jgi:hypothetical protein
MRDINFDRCYRQKGSGASPRRWTRTDIGVNRLSTFERLEYVAVKSATDEAILYLQGLFSPDEERSAGGVQPVDEGQAAHEQSVDEAQAAHELQSPDEERSAGEPQAEVQPVDELQAANELQSPDEERSAGEPQAEVQSVDELQAANELHSAHEPLCFHWSE